MGKTRSNSALDGIRGRVDRWVYRKFLGETIISRQPWPQERVRRGEEAANNKRFYWAAKAARYAMQEIKDRYIARARELNTTAFGLATRDAMHPPRIPVVSLQWYTGQPGQPIFIIARDDFAVKEVEVTVLSSNGRLVERGLAQRCEDDLFRYDTTAALPPGLGAQVIVRARLAEQHDGVGRERGTRVRELSRGRPVTGSSLSLRSRAVGPRIPSAVYSPRRG